jgi:hypothetical protein
MRYSFRLAELINHKPDPRKRPGTIKAIVERTGLDRHQVAALLKNEVKYIPLEALSRICDYLIETGRVSADQLPGALFAVEPEHFWELLARRKRLELCVGVRRAEPDNSYDGAWIVASDAVLMGELLNGVTTLGGTSRHQVEGDAIAAALTGMGQPARPPHPELLRQQLVWSPGQSADEHVVARAQEVHRAFINAAEDKALVCLGSTKSNPVVELIIGEAFGCTPFESQGDVPSPRRRNVPFYFRYRDNDPHPLSCCGGTLLSKAKEQTVPGIYYEQADGSWAVCPWSADGQDAALVFYIHRESQGQLEMVLCGFSGRSTRLLAKMLSSRAEAFWPAVYEGQGLQIGAFVVKFNLSGDAEVDGDLLRTDLTAGIEVIPFSAAVIERRLKPAAVTELATAKPR